ncbi:hypothetical protein DFH08DRAFT_876067 [Mycena albidolilacea]|uniref:Uncharacterized protein n=1 Tax=Mycena albidolilacea TaxID=1033008 RepID=A0AAD6ZTI5_9AGAR|nr:hypothetical protein DFH08DRAFT_876067 [Mycena albidolilacea]
MSVTVQSSPLEPRLPQDLERRIFEIAAMDRPVSIPKLMLVAWRAKDWLEPLLYRVVFLGSSHIRNRGYCRTFGLPTFKEATLKDRPPACFQRVKHLFIGAGLDDSEAEGWLAACPNIINLFIQFSSTPLLRVLNALHGVRCLTIDVCAICGTDIPHILFLAVTHLELLELSTIHREDAVRLSQNLALIPHLTHIALNPNLDRMVSHAALAADTRLQCIAFLWSSPYALGDTSPLLNDARFVCIQQSMEHHLDYRTDWLRGAVGGDDYWALADTFIAARRAGKVERGRYNICDTDNPEEWKGEGG